MRGIPIGVQDFKRIRDRNGYYVDKSPLIDYVLDDGAEVFQFTRPRRFGKSTNLSMIDAYLNIRHAGNGWFDGLKISDMRPDDPEKNSYPVIRLDMKRVAVSSYDFFLEKMRSMVADVCKQFPELGTSDVQDQDDIVLFRQFKSQNGTLGNLSDSLLILSRMLKRQYGRDVVILVDEYDNPLNTSYGHPDQRAILEYLRDFLSSALKGNDSLRLGVVTGVMQIAKESIFSGLNNLEVNNIFSEDVDEMFGFTPEEVERMCADFGHPEKFAEAREWYDGYRFGNADIYSTWSILKYVNSGFKPAPYWAGTSGNDIISDLLVIPDQETYDNIIALASGDSIPSDIEPGVTFADISDLGRGIYSVMAFSGYLTAVYDVTMGRYMLRIPNREMFSVFADVIIGRLRVNGMSRSVCRFATAVLDNDTDSMGVFLKDLFEYVISGRVLDNEHSYQAFIAGLLMNLFGNYEITADFESGEGYHDIRMKCKRGNGPNIVMEIKRSKAEDPSASIRGADAVPCGVRPEADRGQRLRPRHGRKDGPLWHRILEEDSYYSVQGRIRVNLSTRSPSWPPHPCRTGA